MTSKMRAKDTKLKNHSLRLFSIGANNPKYLRELLSSAQYGNFCLTLIKGNIDEREKYRSAASCTFAAPQPPRN